MLKEEDTRVPHHLFLPTFLFCSFLFLSSISHAQEQKRNIPYGPVPDQTAPSQNKAGSKKETSPPEQKDEEETEFEEKQEKFESGSIDLGTNEGTGNEQRDIGDPDTEVDFVELGIWTAVVIVLIFGVFYLLKKFLPATRKLFSQPGMEVLSRISLTRNGSLFLVEVGDRILRIGVTGEEMTYMGEVSDPDEVARLKSECNTDGDGRTDFSDTFSSVFGNREARAPEGGSGETSGTKLEELNQEISGLQQMIKSWRE